MNEHPSPDFEKEIRETFSAAEANSVFVRDLRGSLIERSKMKKQTRILPRLAWGLAIAILLIGLLIASPRIAQALKKLLGYVPGLGYVEQGTSLRVLSAPVTVEKYGLKVTVEKGAADSQQTILLEHTEGYTRDRYGTPGCDAPARLVLPDGTIVKELRYETGHIGDKGESANGAYYGRYVFEALPPEALEATLEIPCLMFDFDYKDWVLALHFQAADATQIMPVIELPTDSPPATEAPVTSAPTVAPASPAESTLEGFSIVLESETPLPDGYILSGSYQWTDPRFTIFSVQPIDPKITDANGRQITFETVDPGVRADPAVKKLPFAYQIEGKDHAWPLTMTVNSLVAGLPDQGTFQFDAGPNPQLWQVWNVSIDVPVGGHSIHVHTIQVSGGRTPTEFGFDFTMTSDPAVMSATVTDANPPPFSIGGGGGGGGDNATPAGAFTSGWANEGYSPSGVKTFVVSNVYVTFKGTWQAIWQPSTQ